MAIAFLIVAISERRAEQELGANAKRLRAAGHGSFI